MGLDLGILKRNNPDYNGEYTLLDEMKMSMEQFSVITMACQKYVELISSWKL